MDLHNLYDNIPAQLPEELFTDILKTDHFRVERIVSQGHASPEGFWYDQDQKEWVMVLEGAARIRFEDGSDAIQLRPGDYLTNSGAQTSSGRMDRPGSTDGVAGSSFPSLSDHEF